MKNWTNPSTSVVMLSALALAVGAGCGDGDTGTTIDDPATIEVVVDLESGQLTWSEDGLAAAMTDRSKPVRFVMRTPDGTTLTEMEGSSLDHLYEQVADLAPGHFREFLAAEQQNLATSAETISERTDSLRQQRQANERSRE